MLNNTEVWSNEVRKLRRRGKKNETCIYEMSGTSLQGKKLECIIIDALDGRVMETDTYWHFYALACPAKNINEVTKNETQS